MNEWPTPRLPKTHLDVLDGIDAESIEFSLTNPVLVNLRHPRPHVIALRPEIIETAQFAQLDLVRVVVIVDEAVVMEERFEGGISGVQVKGRRILSRGIMIPQFVTVRWVLELSVTRFGTVNEITAVVHDDIVDDEQAASMGCAHKMPQIREAAPVGIDLVKIAPGVAVKLPARVEHDRRNPNRRRAQCFDVIQLQFQPLEISAMNRCAAVAARIIVTIRIVVRRIAIEETVGDYLVNALALPEIRGVLGTGPPACEDQANCKRLRKFNCSRAPIQGPFHNHRAGRYPGSSRDRSIRKTRCVRATLRGTL